MVDTEISSLLSLYRLLWTCTILDRAREALYRWFIDLDLARHVDSIPLITLNWLPMMVNLQDCVNPNMDCVDPK